ncbi:FAD-dependent oxidoreductase [Lentzea alba]|uniref:FAD-binding oxidoreductase n=1 Tax=Lentzea alba TaxID=2714351 RepID=UPI0039BEDD80
MDITTLGTVHVATPNDIAATMRFAARQQLRVTTSRRPLQNDVVLDLTALKGVTVNAGERTVEVQAGTTWAELDAATQAHGLVTPGPRLSRCSVVSAVLGRAPGWLTPLYGTTRDNLVRAECITADGRLITTEEPEGVITSVTLKLHPLAHKVYGGVLLYRLADAPTALGVLGELASRGREFAGLAAYVTAPPERFVPGDLVGRRVLAVVPTFVGDPVIGASCARPLRVKARPLVDQARPLAYVEQQSLFDDHVPHHLRCETAEVPELTPDLLRHFEDTSTALRVLVPHHEGWTVHEGEQ